MGKENLKLRKKFQMICLELSQIALKTLDNNSSKKEVVIMEKVELEIIRIKSKMRIVNLRQFKPRMIAESKEKSQKLRVFHNQNKKVVQKTQRKRRQLNHALPHQTQIQMNQIRSIRNLSRSLKLRVSQRRDNLLQTHPVIPHHQTLTLQTIMIRKEVNLQKENKLHLNQLIKRNKTKSNSKKK